MGWAAVENGKLLTLAANEFDVFVTVDRNLTFQQNLPRFDMAVVVLRALTNRLEDLRPLVSKLLQALPTAKRGEAIWANRATTSSKLGHPERSERRSSRAKRRISARLSLAPF